MPCWPVCRSPKTRSPRSGATSSGRSDLLPVDAALPELLDALENHPTAVLQAPTGSGKTTRAPMALLEAGWRQGRRIVMLEPRRLAARSAARFMAGQLGGRVGQAVGCRRR